MSAADIERAAQLRRMRRRATGLLVVVAAVFAALIGLPLEGGWVAYALAATEGSMVGGLADWFAVTALFRHPLGIPIPHTAVIRQRKDQFGEALGGFIQQNFLSSDVVAERIRASQLPQRVAAWLATPANADIVSRSAFEALTGAVDLIGDDDLHRLLHSEIERAVRAAPFAPLAGHAVRVALDEHRHRPLVNAALRGAVTFLDDQREPLRDRFGDASPWWLPGAVEDRLFDRLLDGARLLLATVAADPEHEIRTALDERLRALAGRLEQDPATAARVDEVVGDLLGHPDFRAWTRTLWDDLRRSLQAQLDVDDSRVRARLAEAVVDVGERLGRDPALQQRLADAAESAVRYVTDHHHEEISSLVSATIARWDAEETSAKLELLLGRDLQFIRINGTVVGGLAGLAIHAVTRLVAG